MTSPYPRKSSVFGADFDPLPIVAADDKGVFLIYRSPDGKQFTIDAADAATIGQDRWRWLESRSASSIYVIRRKDLALLHRILLGAPRGSTVDHEDGDTLCNRRHNLRLLTTTENCVRKHHFRRTSSGLRGVYDQGNGRWTAVISVANRTRYLGTFRDPIEAARAFDVAAVETRGTHAIVNGV